MESQIAELLSRLPELEWQLSKLDQALSNSIPAGVFYQPKGAALVSYVVEIKQDIARLDSLISLESLHYLVIKINRKIHILVALCKQSKKTANANKFNLNHHSTRQTWLKAIEQEISQLTEQQAAITKTFEKKKQITTVEQKLNYQQELASVEKQLSLARERYKALC